LPATEDALHQPARLALDQVAGAALDALRADGHAAFLSGAGPSLLVLCPAEQAAAVTAAAEQAVAGADGWVVRPVGLAAAGALASVQVT
jgi:homoserine kinase